ncbi:CGNR zinc finger domain-containing protein [Streptomyces sp. S1D4-11]
MARDAVLLVGGPLLARVKECENPECSLLFLDDSQARRRRWCSMDRCGNLAKVVKLPVPQPHRLQPVTVGRAVRACSSRWQ